MELLSGEACLGPPDGRVGQPYISHVQQYVRLKLENLAGDGQHIVEFEINRLSHP